MRKLEKKAESGERVGAHTLGGVVVGECESM